MKTNKKTKTNKKKKIIISKKQKIALVLLIIILVILIILVGHKVCTKYLFNDSDNDVIKVPEKQAIELDNYEYYLHGNASDYEKTLADELKNVLSVEEVNWEEYAKVLSKMFISDLFSLKEKNGSSDITSSQYVYTDYQATFEEMVKDTIYASIEIDLDGTREQSLPIVTNVEVTSITNDKFTYNNEVIDSNAYYVSANIEYAEDLGYPTTYEVVLVKNEDLLQVVKAG